MLDFSLKGYSLQKRGEFIHINARVAPYGRLRFSSGLKHSAANIERVKKNILSFIRENLKIETKADNRMYFMANLCDEFLAQRCSHLKAQTRIRYKSVCDQIAKELSQKDIRLLSQKDILGLQDSSSALKIRLLNRLIDFGKDCNMPITLRKIFVNRNIKAQKDINPLSFEEIKKVLSVARSVNIEFCNYLAIAFFSGMRVGELRALSYSDFDLECGKINVSKSKEQSTNKITSTKTHKARSIDLLDIAKEGFLSQRALYEGADSKTLLFGFSAYELAKFWSIVLKKAGLEPRVLYQTRHSFATMMFKQSQEPMWISQMLGHKSLSITLDYYVRYLPAQKKRDCFVDFSLNDFGALEKGAEECGSSESSEVISESSAALDSECENLGVADSETLEKNTLQTNLNKLCISPEASRSGLKIKSIVVEQSEKALLERASTVVGVRGGLQGGERERPRNSSPFPPFAKEKHRLDSEILEKSAQVSESSAKNVSLDSEKRLPRGGIERNDRLDSEWITSLTPLSCKHNLTSQPISNKG